MNPNLSRMLAGLSVVIALVGPGALRSAEVAGPSQAPLQAAAPPATKQGEPIDGAFGLVLGERFAYALAERVVGRKEHAYRSASNKEINGWLYMIVPKIPSADFNEYRVATTADGVIYSISGIYSDAAKTSKCDTTRRIAAELEARYGRPRGKGSFGNWYAFRDPSKQGYRGVRLYAPKCRSGNYSVVYSDDAVKAQVPQGLAGVGEQDDR